MGTKEVVDINPGNYLIDRELAAMTPLPDWQAYWTAAIARHKARIAAGCAPMPAFKRISVTTKPNDDEEER